ncbi:MAG TPA: hypothetical protein VFY84_13375 [Jiangellales bacterium]|nr:hypothetical protein [Jiangellales bacterium]
MNEFDAHVARVLELPRPAVALQGAGCAQRVAPIALRLGEPVTASQYAEGLDLLWSSAGHLPLAPAADLLGRFERIPEMAAAEAQAPEVDILMAVEALTAALRTALGDDLNGIVRQFTGCASGLSQALDVVADQRTKGWLGRRGALLEPFSDAEKAAREETLRLLRDEGATPQSAARIRTLSQVRAAAAAELMARFATHYGLIDRGA